DWDVRMHRRRGESSRVSVRRKGILVPAFLLPLFSLASPGVAGAVTSPSPSVSGSPSPSVSPSPSPSPSPSATFSARPSPSPSIKISPKHTRRRRTSSTSGSASSPRRGHHTPKSHRATKLEGCPGGKAPTGAIHYPAPPPPPYVVPEPSGVSGPQNTSSLEGLLARVSARRNISLRRAFLDVAGPFPVEG